MVEIQKGIPVPAFGTTKGNEKYPWSKLEKNDSFLHGSKNLKAVMSMATVKGKDLDRRFIARMTDEGVRVWRVA